MCTVIVSTLGSGIVSSLSPLGSRYSVTPSMEATGAGLAGVASVLGAGAASFLGAGAAQATSASAAAAANRLKSFLAALLANAGPELLAALVLAGLVDARAPRDAR